MDIRVIAFDLDGTFLDDGKHIPPENLAALEAAAARGCLIVPATGRIYVGIPEALRSLPFMRWYITANGSYLYDAVEDRAVARAEIAPRRAVEFLRFADTLPVLYDCYQDNFGYISRGFLDRVPEFVTDPGILRLVRELRTPVEELKAYLLEKGEGVQKLQLYFRDMELRRRMLRELPGQWPDLSFSTSVPFNIEINSSAATKGQALCTLCRLLDIDVGAALTLGDGTNDMDLITRAGTGVAMGNADPELKAAAAWVTGDNNHGGFADAVRRFALGEG